MVFAMAGKITCAIVTTGDAGSAAAYGVSGGVEPLGRIRQISEMAGGQVERVVAVCTCFS